MASNSRGHEFQPMPRNDKGHETPLDLNLTQLAKHKESIGRRMHPQLKFECIIKLCH